MAISKRYLDTNSEPTVFDTNELSRALDKALPEVVFCYLHGSAVSGTVKAHSDLDLAVFLSRNQPTAPVVLSLHGRAGDVVRNTVGEVRCDLGVLNRAEPVYRFEVLKGTLLFCRDTERWLDFYSVTCREYEHQLFHYEKQRRYRIEANR